MEIRGIVRPFLTAVLLCAFVKTAGAESALESRGIPLENIGVTPHCTASAAALGDWPGQYASDTAGGAIVPAILTVPVGRSGGDPDKVSDLQTSTARYPVSENFRMQRTSWVVDTLLQATTGRSLRNDVILRCAAVCVILTFTIMGVRAGQWMMQRPVRKRTMMT